MKANLHPALGPDDNFGHLCSHGHYCPIGTAKEIPCPSGTYQPGKLMQKSWSENQL